MSTINWGHYTPGILARAHREWREHAGAHGPHAIAHARVLGGIPDYQTGPRAGQQLADARAHFDSRGPDRPRGWRRP